jgi:hypothetical protein
LCLPRQTWLNSLSHFHQRDVKHELIAHEPKLPK